MSSITGLAHDVNPYVKAAPGSAERGRRVPCAATAPGRLADVATNYDDLAGAVAAALARLMSARR